MSNNQFTSLEEAIAAILFEPCTKLIEEGRFTRWGKNKRYYATRIGEGGYFGNWAMGTNHNWFPDNKHLSKAELRERNKKIAEAKALQETYIAQKHAQAADKATSIWNKSSALQNIQHAYLEKKGVQSHGIRLNGNRLVIPLSDINGKLWSLQSIDQDGHKLLLAGGRKKGCFYRMGNIEGSAYILVGEGYATAASVFEAMEQKLPAIVAIDIGNLEAVVASLSAKYPTAKLVICADNDSSNPINRGKEVAEKVARKYGCLVALPTFSNNKEGVTPNAHCDFNDLCCLEGKDAVKFIIENAMRENKYSKLPPNYALKSDGLYFGDDWLSNPIKVLSYTRDDNNENWGRKINFSDLDGRAHNIAIPMESLVGDYTALYSILLSHGLQVTSNRLLRSKIVDYIQNTEVTTRSCCVPRIGWYDGHFIHPCGVIPENDKISLQTDNDNYTGFRCKGTLAEWQEHVAKLCHGNSRLIFAASCAFAAPLLDLVGAESMGFNLKGNSSIGKSTALAVAASVCGAPRKYIQQWRATGNALEIVAETHNHSLLCLDELGQVEGKEAGEIAYMLANGSGKNRMQKKGGLRKKSEWRLLFLSTGEVSIADKLNEAGKPVKAGMLIRMVDIPADAGKGHRLFDSIHQFSDGGALASHLRDNANKYHGEAMIRYLAALAPYQKEIIKSVEQIKKDFVDKFTDKDSDPQVRRVAESFAIVSSGGMLAAKFNILPFETKEVFEAIETCFKAWLEDRGSDADYESETMLNQVRAFFEMHHSSRFAVINNKDSDREAVLPEKIINQAGYRFKSNGNYDFYVYPNIFKNEICKGLDERAVKRLFEGRGLLLRGKKAFTKPVYIPGFKDRMRMIHISGSILVEQTDTISMEDEQ